MEGNVIKSGELYLRSSLRRSKEGITLEFRVHPAVEELMRSVSKGQISNEVLAPLWLYDQPITFYALGKTCLGGNLAVNGLYYTLARPGDSLFTQNGVNMSFLTLVGASTRDCTLTIKGVLDLNSLRKASNTITLATRQIYNDYLKQVNLDMMSYVQEAPDAEAPGAPAQPNYVQEAPDDNPFGQVLRDEARRWDAAAIPMNMPPVRPVRWR